MSRHARWSLSAACVALVAVVASSSAAIPPPCEEDLDGSGIIDIDDLIQVVMRWGSGDPAADLDASGTVDVNDVTRVILAWGVCWDEGPGI